MKAVVALSFVTARKQKSSKLRLCLYLLSTTFIWKQSVVSTSVT